jgi:hypothetical protein
MPTKAMNSPSDRVKCLAEEYVVPDGPWNKKKIMAEHGKTISMIKSKTSCGMAEHADKEALAQYIRKIQGAKK